MLIMTVAAILITTGIAIVAGASMTAFLTAAVLTTCGLTIAAAQGGINAKSAKQIASLHEMLGRVLHGLNPMWIWGDTNGAEEV
jgi:hypothetical protein